MAQKHINPIQSREQVIKASESNFTELYNMASQGEPNVIEEVQVNGTALPVDSNKAVNIDLTGYVDKTTAQTIAGIKTFSDNMILANNKFLRGNNAGGTPQNLIGMDNSNKVVVGNGGTDVVANVSGALVPSVDSAKDLGNSSYKWRYLYLSSGIKNASYTFTLPTANGQLAIKDDITQTDTQINGTSIVSSKIANFNTYSPYDASTNKVATMQDIQDATSGKTASYVCSDATNPDLNSQNNVVTITSALTDINGDSISLDNFKLGDSVYITETNVPDRWVGAFGGSPLPNEYKELTYIQNNGGGYVDLGILPLANSTIYAKINKNSSQAQSNHSLFGVGSGGSVYSFNFVSARGYDIGYAGWTSINTGEYHNDGLDHIWKAQMNSGDQKIYRDDILICSGTRTGSVTTQGNIYVFRSDVAYNTKMKLYYMYIMDENNIKVHDFRPCYRIADGMIGLYDVSTSTFLPATNQASFTIGNTITRTSVDLYKLETAKVPVNDVQINGTSIVSSNIANLLTNSAYNSSTNKIATISDLPTNADYVDLTSAQSITGIKTFTDRLEINKNNSVGIIWSSGGNDLDFGVRTSGGTTIQNYRMSSANFRPLSDNSKSLGTASLRWTDLYISGGIKNGTLSWTMPSSSGTLALQSEVPTNYVSSVNGNTGAITGVAMLTDIPAQELYWCTYGTTTYAEITQAVTDGKLPVIKYSGITYTYSKDWGSSLGHVFGTMDANFDRWVYCKQTDVWGIGYMEVENSVNKKTTISSSSTNVQYPTAKAVYDYVKDATFTIQKNGTDVATFSANASTNATANIIVPTKTSDLTNDSGFITSAVTSLGGKSGAVTLGSGLSITAGGELFTTGTGAKIVDLGTITLPYTLSDAQYNEVLNNDNVILKYTTSNSTQYVKKLMSFGDYIYFDKTYKDYDSNDGGLGYIMPTIKKSTKKLTHEVQSIFFVGNGLTYDTSTESLAVDTTTIALKSDIPTESTVSGWGFTKNTGTITGVQLNGTSIATSGVANVKALPNFNLNISHQTQGNPRPVKFLTINYATAATYFKMSATSCHDNGTSYQFLEDIIIGCTTSGSVVCNVYKYCQQSVTYDSATRNYGDVFYVIDTTNKIVDFYILCGQYASSQFTPATKIGNTTIAYITQYTGTATYYSSGTKVWANGNSTTYAKLSDVPSTSNFVDLTSAQSISGQKTFTNGISVSGRSVGGGDDEGIVVGTASNNYAGVCCGSPSGRRAVFYLKPSATSGNSVWRYNNGSTTYDIAHPEKAGTIALTSDLPDMSNYPIKLKLVASFTGVTSLASLGLETTKDYLAIPYLGNYLGIGYKDSNNNLKATDCELIKFRMLTSSYAFIYLNNSSYSVYYLSYADIYEITRS